MMVRLTLFIAVATVDVVSDFVLASVGVVVLSVKLLSSDWFFQN